MTAAPRLRFTFREYLRVDAKSTVKHEFLDGMILAMAVGTPDHAGLAAAVTASLNRQLEGKRCRVYSADRGEKLRQYQQIVSLFYVVLVSHDEKRIDTWSRGDEGWNVASAQPGESVVLERIGCRLDVDDIHRDPLSA